MATLPWGFSPINALKQVGDAVNPFNGATNYDVFSQAGDQRGQVQGTSTSRDIGYAGYDPATGQAYVLQNGAYTPVGRGNYTAQDQPTTTSRTTGARTTGATTVSAPSNDFYGPGGSQRNSEDRTFDEQAAEDERVKQQQLGLYDQAIGEADKGFGILDEQKRIGLENVAGSYIGHIPMRNCLLFHNRKYISKVIHTEEVAYDLVCNIINRRRASI